MDCKVGDRVVITAVNEGSARRRLLDFGFTVGAGVQVCNIAPFGGTVLVALRGYTVAIRELAGALIEVRYPTIEEQELECREAEGGEQNPPPSTPAESLAAAPKVVKKENVSAAPKVDAKKSAAAAPKKETAAKNPIPKAETGEPKL